MKKIIFASLAASLLIGGGVAIAHQHEQGPHGDRGSMGGDMFEMADVNNDGIVTRTEATEALAKHFASMDSDGNGTITAAEREASRGKMVAQHFATMDADSNGSLSLAEFQAGHEEGADGRPGPRGGKMGRMMGGMMDRDLSRDQFMSRPMAMFDRLDTNKDGQITAAERDAAMEKMRERWEGRKGKRDAG